jgi:hypothetical protein
MYKKESRKIRYRAEGIRSMEHMYIGNVHTKVMEEGMKRTVATQTE